MPVVLSKTEVKALLEAPTNLRHRAILATMYGAELRVSEMVGLKVSDLDRERHVIWVRGGKGHKDRQVMLAEPLREVLAAYWRWKRPTDWLFPCAKPGCPIARNSVFQACRKAARRAGITKPVHPHSLRHAFATHLREDRVNLVVIQTLLGHAHLRTTPGYLHLSDSAVRSVGTSSVLISEKPSRPFATAARLRSAAMWSMWSSATSADIGSSPITHAVTEHCPKCQASARAKWLTEREAELLPVPYFHVVFTLPETIGGLARQNAREIYGILFRAASETLFTIAADSKRLGAAIGFLAVLHTWGQNLHLHPHLHCVVPGGHIGPDQASWVGCRKQSFFLPVHVLGVRFRNVFLIYLWKAFREGRLRFHGEMAGLAKPGAFEALCRRAQRKKWVVNSKPPFAYGLAFCRANKKCSDRRFASYGSITGRL